MPLQPLPPGTTHVLSKEGMAFLPPFVRARLDYLANTFEWYPDADESVKDEENDEELVAPSDEGNLTQEGESDEDGTCFTYHEVRGKLSDGYYSVGSGVKYVSPINIWMGGDDECNRSLYLGGSACWICPSNHALYFDAIDPALLPETPDLGEWWCVQYEEGIKVIRITVCPPEAITEGFPDGV